MIFDIDEYRWMPSDIRRQKIKTGFYVILAVVAAGAAGYGIGKGLGK